MMWKPGTAKPQIDDFVNSNNHHNDRKRSHSTDSHHHRRRIKAEEQQRDIKEHTIKPTTGAVSQLSNGTRNMRFMQRNKSLSPSKSQSLISSSPTSNSSSTTFPDGRKRPEINTHNNKPTDMDVDENDQSDDSDNDDSSDDDVVPMQTTNQSSDKTRSNSAVKSEDNDDNITAVTSIPSRIDSNGEIKNISSTPTKTSQFLNLNSAKSITKRITSSSSTILSPPEIASSSDMYGVSGMILGRRSFGGFNKYVAENHYYSSLYVKEMMPSEDTEEITNSSKKKKKKKNKRNLSLSDQESSIQKNHNDDDNDDNIDFKDYNDMERHNKKKKKYGN